MIVSGEKVARFVSERLGFGLCPPYVALGIENDGDVVAGALFNCFEGHDVHVTVAGKGWTPGFVEAVGNYVFHQLQCARMTAITQEPKVVGYARRLGGEIEGRLRNHFGPGRDGIILGILRESWPYGISYPFRAPEPLDALPEEGSAFSGLFPKTARSGSDRRSSGGHEHRHGCFAATAEHGRYQQPVGQHELRPIGLDLIHG